MSVSGACACISVEVLIAALLCLFHLSCPIHHTVCCCLLIWLLSHVYYYTVQRRCDKWLIASFSKTPCISLVCSNIRHSSWHFICQLRHLSTPTYTTIHCTVHVSYTYTYIDMYMNSVCCTPNKNCLKVASHLEKIVVIGYYLTAMRNDRKHRRILLHLCTIASCVYI